MNTKIFKLIEENLHRAFALEKYHHVLANLNSDTKIDQLPWTPARYKKFKDAVWDELQLTSDYVGTVKQVVDELSEAYIKRFFSEIWKPRTGEYDYSGWALAEEIAKQEPKSVLDVGCGYHPFKGRIPNLVGIDPYNNCADFMVDILDYKVKPASHDHIIALGSINFNSQDDIEQRFAHCVDLLAPGGKFYLRANPGIPHKTGPYVDIFPWTFEIVNEFAERYNLKLLEFKREPAELGRLYFVYLNLKLN
jgi:SAM-dependent methyltransferase